MIHEIARAVFIALMMLPQSYQGNCYETLVGTAIELAGTPKVPTYKDKEKEGKGTFIMNPKAKKNKIYKLMGRLHIHEIIKGLQVLQNDAGVLMALHIIVKRVALPNANGTMTIRSIIQKRQQG